MKTLFVADGHNYVPDWIIAHIGVIGYNIVVGIVFLSLIYVAVIRPIISFFKEKKENGQSRDSGWSFLYLK